MRTVAVAHQVGEAPAVDRTATNGNGRFPHGANGNGSAAVAMRARRLARGRVLVLNASYEPLNVCTVRRALVLILKQKAEVLEHGDGVLRSETMRLDEPEVIRLVTYVRVPRNIHRRRITRKAVLARDSWTCQYCGTEKPGLTVDHVIPRSRGGESVWENIVASCAACNRRKGNRLPHEIRMHPRSSPRPPGPTVFIRIAAPRTPPTWEPYLPAARA
jgi:5-methylcytosine-specific restriction endonuclease McrA